MMARRRILDFIRGKIPPSIAVGDTLRWDGDEFRTGGGGGGAGGGAFISIRHETFEFTFATPNLHNGVVAYEPEVGDIIYDAWFNITEAWSDTDHPADIGTFVGQASGIFNNFGDAVLLPPATDEEDSSTGEGTTHGRQALGQLNNFSPITFTNANPLKVVVSSDGTTDGDPTGATSGAATLHLLIIPA